MDTATATAPQVQATASKPWPEPSWLYRRWFCFIVAVGILTLWALALDRGAVWQAQVCLAVVLVAVLVVYVVGASGEQIAHMVAGLSLLKSGVNFSTVTEAISPSGAKATATTTSTATAPAQPPAMKPPEPDK